MNRLYGGIEAGGTKFVCMVGRGLDAIEAEARFPTTTPEETLQAAVEFFHSYRAAHPQAGELAAVGIGAFGPLDLHPGSPTYGYITTTPKPGWGQVNLCGRIREALNVPVAIDTDVNAAAIGELDWAPENRDLDPFVYITVGTGIGVGVVVNGEPLHGLIHPEAGHGFIPHDRQADPFPGVCPYHGDCLEGLASGPAMGRRWGVRAEELPDDHPGWALEARYLALGVGNLICSFSPQRIVLGGGVLQHPGLLEQVRAQTLQLLNGYIQSDRVLKEIDHYLVSPRLGSRAGVLGAMALAMRQEGA